MIAIAKPSSRKKQSSAWHGRFLALLPDIVKQAHAAFWRGRPEAKEEFVQHVVAHAFCAFARLVERGKADLAYPTPLANYAIRQIRSGRCVGTPLNVNDITSRYAQNAKDIAVERLDRFDGVEGEWRQFLVEDRSASPADTAAARIDMTVWFRSLGRRNRRLARALARGEGTLAVARMFRISAARVSQLRNELRKSWNAFQGSST